MAELTDHDRRAYEANVWKSYLFHFCMHFQLWWSIWVIYLTDLRGFTLTQISTLEALFWGTAVVAEIPTGAVADRFGRKWSMALGAASMATAVLVFGLATNYWIVLASYMAWAAGIAFLSGAEHAMLFESLKAVGKEGDFQRAAGRLGAVFSFAALAGGIIGAPIAAATDLSIPVVLSAAIAVPGIAVALSMREPELPEGEVRLAYGSLLRESAATALRMPSVRSMILLAALVAGLTFGPMLFMQPFLSHHHVDVGLLGLIQTPVRVLGIIGSLAAYAVIARLGMRGAFVAAPIVFAASFALLGGWGSVYAFAAFPAIALVNALLLPPSTDYVARRVPNNQRATILSLRTMLSSLIAAALTPGLGMAADRLSLGAMFWIAGGVAAVALSAALFLWLRADLRESELSSPEAQPAPAG